MTKEEKAPPKGTGQAPDLEKQLVWRFKELPTAGEVAELVETKVITPAEARAILFKEETKQSDEVEALKEMVKALQEMVKDLLLRQNNITFVPYTKIVEVPTRISPYWNKYWDSGTVWCNASSTLTTTGGNTAYTLSVKQ
jgi:hypothetical protein